MKEAEKNMNISFNDTTNSNILKTEVNSLTDSSKSLQEFTHTTSTPLNTKVCREVSQSLSMNESMVADKTAPNNLDKKDVFTTHDTQQQNKLPERTQISLEILGNEWLTDESIQFYYQVLAAKVIDNTKILLMNPIISQAIKCLSDFEHVLDKVELQGKTHIVIPVNDSPAVDKPGGSGSHWSLLLYVAEMEEFLYYDSLGLKNFDHAVKISSALQTFLNKNVKCKITPVNVPQQSNGFDCGIYLLLFTEIIVQKIKKEKESFDSLQLSFTDIKKKTL
ncbi:hypothetical protein J6590_054371 [Homalodisca vitripennis]|nr:hypothetical protein J6590_054371 [Homalodisca vitripennis]